MTAAIDALKAWARDYQVSGLPGSGVNEPSKSEFRAAVDLLGEEIDDIRLSSGAGRKLYLTWTELAAVSPAPAAGTPAEVADSDSGTHTDPVAGGTVANAGLYSYVTGSPSGWRRVGNTTTQAFNGRVTAVEAEQVTPLAVTASVSPAVAEVGSTQTVTVSGTVTRTPGTLSINQGIGSQTPGTSYSATKTGVTSDTTFTTSAVSGLLTRTASASISFQRRRYYGVTTKAPGVSLTNSEILALTGEFDTDYFRSGLVFDCSASGGRYPVICWPAAWGAPSSITVGGLAFTDFTIEEQSVTNASGSAATYKILRFNGIQTGAAISVSF